MDEFMDRFGILTERQDRVSKYGIRLPAPKLDLPYHLKDPDALLEWSRHMLYPKLPDPTIKDALVDLNRHWRIERSRADDLERMVELLERELAGYRKPSFWATLKARVSLKKH